jgi:hypothetical protein
MASAKTRVQAGDVISATLMNDILEQLEEIQGGTPTDLAQLQTRLQQLESWKGSIDPTVARVNGIDTRLSGAESSLNRLSNVAEDVKTLQRDLAALTTRVATLESQVQVTSKVRISGFDPPSSSPVGQVLTIIGAGFKPTLTQNLVFINETPIYNYRLDSDSTHLRIVIPTSIPGVTIPPDGNAAVTIRVSNDDGEGSRSYRVTAALPVTGTPPKITKVYKVGSPNTPVLATTDYGVAEGQGLGRFSFTPGQAQKPAVAVIYQTNTGPVTYNVPEAQIEFQFTGATENVPIQFIVPYILEAPNGTPFNALLRVGFGNHVPALAQVQIQKAA